MKTHTKTMFAVRIGEAGWFHKPYAKGGPGYVVPKLIGGCLHDTEELATVAMEQAERLKHLSTQIVPVVLSVRFPDRVQVEFK